MGANYFVNCLQFYHKNFIFLKLDIITVVKIYVRLSDEFCFSFYLLMELVGGDNGRILIPYQDCYYAVYSLIICFDINQKRLCCNDSPNWNLKCFWQFCNQGSSDFIYRFVFPLHLTEFSLVI